MSEQPQVTSVEFKKSDDFSSLYANNIQIQASAWDIKLIFGELEQIGAGKELIEQHTAISIPWPQAKLFSHLLATHIAAAEIENGKIAVPMRVVPPEPTLSPEAQDNAMMQSIVELISKKRAEFLETL